MIECHGKKEMEGEGNSRFKLPVWLSHIHFFFELWWDSKMLHRQYNRQKLKMEKLKEITMEKRMFTTKSLISTAKSNSIARPSLEYNFFSFLSLYLMKN